jgi:hypothetical protein
VAAAVAARTLGLGIRVAEVDRFDGFAREFFLSPLEVRFRVSTMMAKAMDPLTEALSILTSKPSAIGMFRSATGRPEPAFSWSIVLTIPAIAIAALSIGGCYPSDWVILLTLTVTVSTLTVAPGRASSTSDPVDVPF